MARNVHKSVLHALDISQQEGHFIETHQSPLTNHYNKVNLSRLNNDGHKLAVLTYPNYYGETFYVEEVIKSLHQLNIPVLNPTYTWRALWIARISRFYIKLSS